MLFKDLSIFLKKLDETTSRNTLTEILSDLFKKASASEIDKIVYLLQGRVSPLFTHQEFQMADKMVLKAITLAYDGDVKHVLQTFKKLGDLGLTASHFAKNARGTNLSVD